MNLEPGRRIREYETGQLIPYLGNKRSLIPRLRCLFESLTERTGSAVFLDPFAGAGSVSRLARSLGMRVRANDWEPYSYCVNRCWLALTPSDVGGMFRHEGGLPGVLARLNAFHPERENRSPDPEPEPYMAAWYAPGDTLKADWRTERLFYTRENAVFLDRVREEIARRGPLESSDDPVCSEGQLLLALLILEAATHANTSGVFKAFHRGFGGHGRDALPRILGAMELEAPILPEAGPAEVYREDAARFVRRFSADIAYLDPPYNQHQYGSNYHILNTLVLWDRAPVPLDTGPDGRLLRKAGIPEAWRKTWSPYCSRSSARDALIGLIDGTDAKTIVLSYNTEGIVPPEEILDILSTRWDVRTEILDYVRYRGGRQSSARRVRNHELIYIGKPRRSRGREDPVRERKRLTEELRLRRLLTARFDPERIRSRFKATQDGIEAGEAGTSLPMWHLNRFRDPRSCAEALPGLAGLGKLSDDLEACEITDNLQAVRVLAGLARACLTEAGLESLPDARSAAGEALTALRKLAHPKYLAEYDAAEKLLVRLAADYPALGSRLQPGLARLGEQREARLKDRGLRIQPGGERGAGV